MVNSEYEDKRKQMLDQDYCQASAEACECGAKERTSERVITSCPIYHYPNGARALSDINQSL